MFATRSIIDEILTTFGSDSDIVRRKLQASKLGARRRIRATFVVVYRIKITSAKEPEFEIPYDALIL